MDPALWRILDNEQVREIEAIIRLTPGARAPEDVRLVALFGDIATCRLSSEDILETWADSVVDSLKATRLLQPEPNVELDDQESSPASFQDERRPPGLQATGEGVIVASIDWGCDFAHPDFCHEDGRTRLLALWDQRGPASPDSPQPYNYGRLHTADSINRALQSDDPYAALGYHPADGDPDGSGSHGCHVLSIAAGNGRGGGPFGMAPDADLIFVHLASREMGEFANLGDSVTLLEAVDFIVREAGERPVVINLSVGRHGGPHDGCTLVEQGLDYVVTSAPGRCVVQSSGNYYDQSIHTSGRLRPGESRHFFWHVDAADRTPNELEIWYPERDVFVLEILPPKDDPASPGSQPVLLAQGQRSPVMVNGRVVGQAYHRQCDPNNHHHHINIFLDPGSPAGSWEIRLFGQDVADGRYHAWVERDAVCPGCQSHLEPADSDPSTTTGTICNGFWTIAVGAYNAHSPGRELGSFSSSGPTVDGRQKPDCLAPGVSILAARSHPAGAASPAPLYTRKSGTSMAAPYVTGAVACLMQAAGRLLDIHEVRAFLLANAETPGEQVSPLRSGSGFIDIEAAIQAVTGSSPAANLSSEAIPAAVGFPSPAFFPTGGRRESFEPQDHPTQLEERSMPRIHPANIYQPLADWIENWTAENGVPFPHPASLFDALTSPRLPGPAAHYQRLFEVVAAPGQVLEAALQPNDLVVRRALGEGRLAAVTRISQSETLNRADLPGYHLLPDSAAEGLYAAGENRRALRLANAEGRLPENVLILRPRRQAAMPDGWESFTAPALDYPVTTEDQPSPKSPLPTAPKASETLTFHLLVDANRDGALDTTASATIGWSWGKTGQGAIVLVNNDDDGINGRPDNEDDKVDNAADAGELAPLTITRSSGAAAGWKLELSVDHKENIRIFEQRAAGAKEIIGPTTGPSHNFANLAPQRFDLGMEGVRYAGGSFDGLVRLTLRATSPSGAVSNQTVIVRIAPWIMSNHLDDAATVFVVDVGSFNNRFRTELLPMVTAAGCTLTQFTPTPADDIWMQDVAEFGFANLPGKGFHTVLRSPNPRSLRAFARSLLDDDTGFLELGDPSVAIDFNSTGNLEVTPPVRSQAGKNYPFGRIYFCPGTSVEPFDADIRSFLHKQVVQEPIEVDTTWLTVGHVDEVISFVPAPDRKHFRMLLASPRRAYQILDALKTSHGSDKLLNGRSMDGANLERTITNFLALHEDFHPTLQALKASGHITFTSRPLRQYNTDRQADIDRIKSQLILELGLDNNDIIDIPLIYLPNSSVPPHADALTANMVNMVVINKRCIIPKPFGPVVGGVDQFEKEVKDKLTPLGVSVHFLDDWNEYHVRLGEIHCATNTLRKPTQANWWEFQP